MRTAHVVYIASALAHVALGSAVAAVRPPPVRETVRITVREVRRARPTPPSAAPTPAPTRAPAAVAAPAPTPAPAARPAHSHARPQSRSAPAPSPSPTASSAPPDFGVALGGEVGTVGVPGGGGAGGDRAAPAGANEHEARPAHASDGCDEAVTRPRVIEMPEPEYPDAARDEGIEGRVRVELNLDDEGQVTGARVLQGLGHGLDEAALAAARGARFEPATRCGHAVATTFTLAVRFAL